MADVKTGCVYRIVNTVNGHCYIGSTLNAPQRLGRHLQALLGGYHSNQHLQRAFNRDGKENFRFEVIEDGIDPLFVLAREQFAIWREVPAYNKTQDVRASTAIGFKHSAETRAKTSESHKGKLRSPESIAKQSATLRGREIKWRDKISSARKGVKQSAARRAQQSDRQKAVYKEGCLYVPTMTGRRHSEATRAKMAITATGRTHSAETRAKISAARVAAALRAQP